MSGQAMQLYAPGEALPSDPSNAAWPATLPLEIALKVAPIPQICKSFGISREMWDAIRVNPSFISQLGRAVEELRIDGMDFKMRAKLQSVELLKVSWEMIHNKDTPPHVRANMIAQTFEVAGLNEAKNKSGAAVAGGKVGAAFQININFGEP